MHKAPIAFPVITIDMQITWVDYWWVDLQTMVNKLTVVTSPAGVMAKYCEFVMRARLFRLCLCVCLAVREDISGTTGAIFTNFSVHVAYGHGSVLLWQDDEIPRGRGSFEGFLSHWQCIVTHSLQKG